MFKHDNDEDIDELLPINTLITMSFTSPCSSPAYAFASPPRPWSPIFEADVPLINTSGSSNIDTNISQSEDDQTMLLSDFAASFANCK